MMHEEQLAFFPGDVSNLAGILTVPSAPNGIVVLLPWGAGAYPSSARNRIRTRLARALADRGFHSFRFDYQGVGESEGEYRVATMGNPYTDDVLAATTWLQSQGLDRLMIVANCFGAWSSLAAAPSIRGLEGMVLVNCPVRRDHREANAAHRPWRWWLRHLRRLRISKLRNAQIRARYRRLARSKASEIVRIRHRDVRFTQAISQLIGNRVPLLLMYGSDGFRPDFEAELDGELGAALRAAGPPTRPLFVTERVEGFATLASQNLLIETVTTWLDEVVNRTPHPTERAS
jgi:alpha/beta superfamily hydrolase